MFSTRHYVPILKWKRAEQGALKGLVQKHKQVITPLIQFVMPKPQSGTQKLSPQEQFQELITRFEAQTSKIPEKLIEVWGTAPIFIDVSLLYTPQLKAKSFNAILRSGAKLGGHLIPVIYLADDPKIKTVAYSLAKENKSGMCLRLVCSEFSDLEKLKRSIAELLSTSRLYEKDIDLLVDIKETGQNSDKYTGYLRLSQSIPGLLKWRTFIFASGSFPEDLTKFQIDDENLVSRVDWESWTEHIRRRTLQRNPSFADYTIQHPIYKEKSQFFPPTSSIKYTLQNEWLIMKGKRQAFKLYLANAALLIKDERFFGEDFSDGDKYIYAKAKHFETYMSNPAVKGTGSTETWLRAGINHHLVLVAHQVANLT